MVPPADTDDEGQAASAGGRPPDGGSAQPEARANGSPSPAAGRSAAGAGPDRGLGAGQAGAGAGPADTGDSDTTGDSGKEATDEQADQGDNTADEVRERLKNEERAQDAADFVHQLASAAANLGGATGGGPSVQFIMGGVHNSGTIAGGGVHTRDRRTFQGEVMAGPVPAETLDEIGRTYVKPGSYGELVEALDQRAVVLLQAPAGWGRTTTALSLLGARCDAVQMLHPDADLRKMSGDDLTEKTGYLLEARTVDQLQGVRETHLQALSAACRSRSAQVVVTVDDSITVGAAAHKEFGVVGGSPCAIDAVLRRHLAITHDLAPSAVLDQDAVRELLDGVADGSLGMRDTVDLAMRLARVAAGTLSVEDLRDRLDQRSQQSFTAWLDATTDSAQHALIVALAVFNSMPYITVAQVEHDLERRFREAEDPEGKAPRQVFGLLRSERLTQARAESFELYEPTRYGNRRVEGVRFRNETYPRRILDWIWHQHDLARYLVLDWLEVLGRHHDRAVRVRAAATIGLFATYDLEWMRQGPLWNWARSDNVRERENAVAALNLASTGTGLAPVTRMLREWVRSRNPNIRWTAARALGASVGGAIRNEALRILGAPAGVDDVGLSFAIGDSLIELYVTAADPEAGAHDVLRTVSRWSRAGRFRRRQTATICFLLLAHDVLMEDVDGNTWPALLALADRSLAQSAPADADDGSSPEARPGEQVLALWHQALDAALFRSDAETAFGFWIELAADSEPVLDALLRLTRRLADASPYTAGRLRLAARDVRIRRKRKPLIVAAADAVIEQLDHQPGNKETLP